MQSYGNSFGFRRSSEYLFSGPENARIPLVFTGLQGDLVTLDPATGGDGVLSTNFLKIADAGSPIVPGVTGLLIQREEFITSDEINRYAILNTRDLSRVRNGQLAMIVTGAGLKIWLKNLAAVTTANYKAYSAETRVTLTGLAVGDKLKWTGTVYAKTTVATEVVATVTRVTATGVEATLVA